MDEHGNVEKYHSPDDLEEVYHQWHLWWFAEAIEKRIENFEFLLLDTFSAIMNLWLVYFNGFNNFGSHLSFALLSKVIPYLFLAYFEWKLSLTIYIRYLAFKRDRITALCKRFLLSFDKIHFYLFDVFFILLQGASSVQFLELWHAEDREVCNECHK